MPTRIDKLLGVLADSNIPEKRAIALAIQKRLPDANEARRSLVESLISYEKGSARGDEAKYRLFSRLTLVLAGIVKSPTPKEHELKQMKLAFLDKYNNLAFAEKELQKVRSFAWGIQKYAPCAVIADEIVAQTRLSEANVQKMVIDAFRVAQTTLELTVQALRADRSNTRELYTKWFGDGSGGRKATVTSNFADMSRIANGGEVRVAWSGKGGFGETMGGGWRALAEPRNYLLLGVKFFDDTRSGEASTSRAASLANWSRVEVKQREYDQLRTGARRSTPS